MTTVTAGTDSALYSSSKSSLPLAAPYLWSGFVFMGNPKPIECPECIQAMTYAKGEPLTRIACANCQNAYHLAEIEKERNRSPRLSLIFRCPECGKWYWTRTSLAIHREFHKLGRN